MLSECSHAHGAIQTERGVCKHETPAAKDPAAESGDLRVKHDQRHFAWTATVQKISDLTAVTFGRRRLIFSNGGGGALCCSKALRLTAFETAQSGGNKNLKIARHVWE